MEHYLACNFLSRLPLCRISAFSISLFLPLSGSSNFNTVLSETAYIIYFGSFMKQNIRLTCQQSSHLQEIHLWILPWKWTVTVIWVTVNHILNPTKKRKLDRSNIIKQSWVCKLYNCSVWGKKIILMMYA